MPVSGENIQRVYVLRHVLWLVKYISYVVFDWLTKMIFSHVKTTYFYVCLNTIFLSGQKLYITLMFMKQKTYITQRFEDMNFIFSWWKQYFPHSLLLFVKYLFLQGPRKIGNWRSPYSYIRFQKPWKQLSKKTNEGEFKYMNMGPLNYRSSAVPDFTSQK